jgi:8-oxo-dGTP pyrophosphatase MutT (NUDIX family)
VAQRDARLQAAVVRGNEILVLEVLIDDGRRLWLLPGGGREPDDVDDVTAVAREVREETACSVGVERLLVDSAAHPDDATYRRYRTFLCRIAEHDVPVAGLRDGFATIHQLRWLRLDDEKTWGTEITRDRFLYPQLQAIRAALTAGP